MHPGRDGEGTAVAEAESRWRPAAATDWWLLGRPLDRTDHLSSAFTLCKPSAGPADVYEFERGEGAGPTIEDKGDKVVVWWTTQTTQTAGVVTHWVTFYRTLEACQKEADVRRIEPD